MASSSKRRRKHDVFLSFESIDLHSSFVGHLNKALDQNGIYTFVASKEMRKGDQALPALMKAIEESCIAVIVFSEDYASSPWCLEELAQIMDCKKQKNLIVFPVFYEVDPREVRRGRESYERALTKHESKFGRDSEKVKRWKNALFDAGNLCGWHLNDGDESELVERIVKEISTHLDQVPLHVAKHPVGIDSRVIKLKSMLNLESESDVVMMGLWGQGGIGKTTLAKALYNAIFRQFEGACFMANVRETSKGSRGLVTLQEILIKDLLLPRQRLVVSSVDRGINLIQHRLGHKKVFLILDDVDDLCQVNAIAGECTWFGNGSRIIFTTRDKHLLICQGIDEDHVYEVKALDDNEAHQLLSKHAFPTHQKLEIRKDLMDSVLNHAKGLPLALEVLGSFLCGRREEIWESTLHKLSRIPNKTINDVLKISFDGLEENEREIFLHIACFFKRKDSAYIKKVLDSCDLETAIGLDILTERSLISIASGPLQMHDLIQAMGIDIVQQECRDDPRRRSRLWLYDDIIDVLSSDMGNCAAIAIVLDPLELTNIRIHPNTLMKMRRLRLLILRNVHNSFQSPIYLPNWLRWLECPGASWNPEFSSGPKKLVGINMREGNITGVVKQFKDFQNLKYVDFSNCELLVRVPDLSCTPNLEELNLRNCKNLIEAHDSIAYHDKLQVLNLRECSELSIFPGVLMSKSLRALDISDCAKFEKFPEIPYKLEGLKELLIQDTAIKGLPTSIENLVSLEEMLIDDCRSLEHLPSSIYRLQNLKKLQLKSCTKLLGFPKYEDSADPYMKTGLPNLNWLDLDGCNLSEVEFLGNLSCFPFLGTLFLGGNNITGLPTSINKRDHLLFLSVRESHQLPELPELPPSLICLLADGCQSLQNTGDLTSFHHFVRRGLTMADMSLIDLYPIRSPRYLLTLPGGEMPKWVLPVEEDSVNFMASKGLYDKFLGCALYVALGSDEQKERCPFELKSHVNGESRDYWVPYKDTFLSDSDPIWLQYLVPSELWGVVDFDQIDGGYVQFGLTVSGKIVKEWGFRIICSQLEDELKVVIRDNKLMDPALLCEVILGPTDSEAKISLMHEDI